jgi:RNA polymerase sigma factor (sigma-70 family)
LVHRPPRMRPAGIRSRLCVGDFLAGATFDKLMELLGPDREQAALEYRRLHERLTRYFDWNGGADPAALADETFDRIERRLDKQGVEGPIENVSAFALGIARRLLLEDLRRQKKAAETGARWSSIDQSDSTEEKELMDEALRHCLSQMPADRRKLIESYYEHGLSKALSHQKLATKYGITINALRTRVLRVRNELEAAIISYLEHKMK